MTLSRAPLRVAFLFMTLDLAGTERQAQILIQGIDTRRITPIVYAIHGGPLAKAFRAHNVPVRILCEEGKSWGRAPLKLRTWLREDHIDILHCLLWLPNLVGRFACAGTNVRCVNSIRWAEQRHRDVLDYASRPLVDWWIANSAHGARLARLPSSRSTIVHNGVDASLLKHGLVWKPLPKTVTMVGAFRREKRFDTFIRAAVLLPDWTFQCVGDGPLLASQQALARTLGVRNVRFLGRRDDVDAILLRSEVAVLLSVSEGTPNVALECLALGVPFIGSDINAYRELLAKERGLMVPNNDPAALVKALQTVALRPAALAQKRRSAAQAYVRNTYASERMVNEMTVVYERLMRVRTRR